MIVAVLNRILEGWTFGLIQGMIYGVSSQELPPKEFDRYARTCSASAGLGESLSLLFGSFLFSIGGYMLPYLCLSGSFVVLAVVIYMSNVLNADLHQSEKDSGVYESLLVKREKSDGELKSKMTNNFALSVKSVRYGCMSIIISNAALTFLDPIIALRLFKMNIYADTAGYIYVFLVGSYCIFGFMGGILESIATKKTLIIAGYIAGALAFTLIGHYSYLNENYVSLIIAGLFINGFSVIGGNMFATMWTKSQLMEAGDAIGISKKETGGYFGGLKGSCNLIGTFTGPFISPYLYVTVGFDKACYIMGSIQLLFMILFAIGTYGDNPSSFKSRSDTQSLISEENEKGNSKL